MPATGSERRLRVTLRLRLTLLYGACFLVAGAGLLGITYVLVAHNEHSKTMYEVKSGPVALNASAFGFGLITGVTRTGPGPSIAGASGRASQSRSSSGAGVVSVAGPPVVVQRAIIAQQRQILSALRKLTQRRIEKIAKSANVYLSLQRTQSLDALLTWSGVALAIMALLSIGLGWLLAGRALKPLRTMNLRALQITADNLHERLGLEGRADELGELAASFDGVLGRLEGAFASQRRFVANASHELRTPVTLQRALVEVALADPEVSTDDLRRTCERVLAAGEQQERLIEALLALARGQAGIESRQPVNLAELASDLLEAREWETRELALELDLAPAVVAGDPALLERLVANLVDNAIVHNAQVDGWIRIATGSHEGGVLLRVTNRGAEIPEARVTELFEPFRRLDAPDRGTGAAGLGLGLSIVQAIAVAHGAAIAARPLLGGGLEVEVLFGAYPRGPRSASVPESGERLRADHFPVQGV